MYRESIWNEPNVGIDKLQSEENDQRQRGTKWQKDHSPRKTILSVYTTHNRVSNRPRQKLIELKAKRANPATQLTLEQHRVDFKAPLTGGFFQYCQCIFSSL